MWFRYALNATDRSISMSNLSTVKLFRCRDPLGFLSRSIKKWLKSGGGQLGQKDGKTAGPSRSITKDSKTFASGWYTTHGLLTTVLCLEYHRQLTVQLKWGKIRSVEYTERPSVRVSDGLQV
jgi:hypothetical protein